MGESLYLYCEMGDLCISTVKRERERVALTYNYHIHAAKGTNE